MQNKILLTCFWMVAFFFFTPTSVFAMHQNGNAYDAFNSDPWNNVDPLGLKYVAPQITQVDHLPGRKYGVTTPNIQLIGSCRKCGGSGCYEYVFTIRVAPIVKVRTKYYDQWKFDDDSGWQGSDEFPRTPRNIERTTKHEKVHVGVLKGLHDKYEAKMKNEKLLNSGCVFKTKAECEKAAKHAWKSEDVQKILSEIEQGIKSDAAQDAGHQTDDWDDYKPPPRERK